MKKDPSILEFARGGVPLRRLRRRPGLVWGNHPGGRRAEAVALRCVLTALLSVAAFCVLPGCRILAGTTAVAVGAVGLVGYGVYKTGEAAVTGVGSVASRVVGRGHSVVFMDGELKASCDGTVEAVWTASSRALRANGFLSVEGSRDALTGRLDASTWEKEAITVKLAASGKDQTELRVRVGDAGDLKKSETVFQLIATEVARERDARSEGGA